MKLPYISQDLMTGGTNQLSHDSLIVAFTAPCTRICRLGTGHSRVYIKKLPFVTYTSIHSLKSLVFKPSTTHRVSHSDFLSKTRRRSRYGGRRAWARGDCWHCARVPGFNAAASQTTFRDQLKYVPMPEHSCSQHARVLTPKENDINIYITYNIKGYQGRGKAFVKTTFHFLRITSSFYSRLSLPYGIWFLDRKARLWSNRCERDTVN